MVVFDEWRRSDEIRMSGLGVGGGGWDRKRLKFDSGL